MTVILLIIDILFSALAFLTAYFLRDKGFFRIFLEGVQPLEVYLKALPFAVLLLVFTLYLFRAYEPKKRISRISELYTISYGVTFWILLIMAGSYLTKFDYSRIIVILFWFFALVLVNFGRYLARLYQARLVIKGKGLRRIIIVGAGRVGREIARKLEGYHSVGIKVIGFVDDDVRPRETVKLLGNISELMDIIEKNKVNEVYFAHGNISNQEILDMMSQCKNPQVRFKVVSTLFELLTGAININEVEEIPSLDLSKASPPLVYKIVKRIFDFVFSLLLFIILSPLFLVLIILIKIDTKGPAIFKQKRIGFRGKQFMMYKFRTMKAKTTPYKEAPNHKNDPRVTKMGRFLRRTSLDELPQLINIIIGEMSLVGPRPEMPFLVERYQDWQRKRLEARPGLTGLWQILGRKDLLLEENIEYDFYYINNQSLLLDLVIIFKTIPLIIFGKGAY